MKFSKVLQQTATELPELNDMFLRYKELKKQLKSIPQQERRAGVCRECVLCRMWAAEKRKRPERTVGDPDALPFTRPLAENPGTEAEPNQDQVQASSPDDVRSVECVLMYYASIR